MKLESQVVSLEHAKRLKELGVKQESLFYITSVGTILHNPAPKPLESYSAYTVAELGEMLKKGTNMLMPVTVNNEWQAADFKNNDVLVLGNMNALTEANARANTLIYYIENKLITV